MLSPAPHKELLINAGAAEFRVAVVEEGRVQELNSESVLGRHDRSVCQRPGHHAGRIGDIILGRVQKVMSGMQAAFIDVGLERAGFLGIRQARCLAPPKNEDSDRVPGIGECVSEGQEIVVQIVKDPIGDKGARLSASATLPGRLLVLVPERPGILLSHRIEDEPERARLTELCNLILVDFQNTQLSGYGFIVRSAATGADLAELNADAGRLAETWQSILEARKKARAPATLHRDIAPIERTLRDDADAQTSRILVDDWETFEIARAYCRHAVPEAESKLELFSGPGALFDNYGVEEDIARLANPRVPLPSGGWITIESTEALTAIDVNSGSFTDATNLEETSLRINREAAKEIGRQLRLRGIGGLVVVDFIHMAEAENSRQVLDTLAASLSRDRIPTQISPMSQFGVVAITRKRTREPLSKRMTEHCQGCDGHGRIRSRESVALDVLRQVERAAMAAPGHAIVVHAAPDVVRWIASHDDEIRAGLMRRGASRIAFEAREEFRREGFDVSTQP